jgi:hypothetical protein
MSSGCLGKKRITPSKEKVVEEKCVKDSEKRKNTNYKNDNTLERNNAVVSKKSISSEWNLHGSFDSLDLCEKTCQNAL